MNLLSNLGWRKISSLWCSKYWKMHLQVRIFNLDIFTCVPLHTKISSKFLSSPSGLIQIHMTAIKHKISQIIYTYELTNTQIFICKVMFFYEVCFLMFFLWSIFLFFICSSSHHVDTIFHLFQLCGGNNSGTTALLKKNSILGKICCQKCSSNVTVLTYSGTFFPKWITKSTLFNWVQNICPWIW